jgi:hypothetical protein
MDQTSELRRMYLDLIKRSLTGMIYEDEPIVVFPFPGFVDRQPRGYNRKWRELGRDCPSRAHSMIGMRRMDNIQFCVEQALADNVPGDLIETGVWKGGATIFMRALLKAHQIHERLVWVADSFQGLPAPEPSEYPEDAAFHKWEGSISIPMETVRHHFEVYGLLDGQVRFLKGWFKDTLPAAPIDSLAVMRLDGDYYQSTMEALTYLYPRLSPGGYVIIDDYFALPPCRKAVEDYRAKQGISDEMLDIDGTSVFWRRESGG